MSQQTYELDIITLTARKIRLDGIVFREGKQKVLERKRRIVFTEGPWNL